MPDHVIPYDPGSEWPASARFDALIIGGPHSADGSAAAAAIQALGGRVLARVLLDDAASAVEAHRDGRVVLVLDVAELPVGAAADHAAAGAALAQRRAWPLVVAIARTQIDAVSAALLDVTVDAQLLCEAPVAEWVAAIALTAQQRSTDGGRVRESEAARLARLNEEVARIAEVLARLSGRDGAAGTGAGEKRGDFGAGAPAVAVTSQEVRDVIRARRLRERYFPAGLFEDPAWDMLLDLFAAHLERGQVSVSSLCIAAAVAPTTALRWIGKLTDAGLLAREPDPFDRRRAFVTLTQTARDGMARYLAALGEFGLRMV